MFDHLDPQCCTANLAAGGKEEALRALAKLAAGSPLCNGISTDTILREMSAREQQGSTGFGREIAIPHARLEGMSGFLLYLAVAPKGIDFDAIDRKKVKLFCVILGPKEEVQEHIKALSAVSGVLRRPGVVRELLAAPSPVALVESFQRHTRGNGQSVAATRKMKLVLVILYLDEFLYDILEFFIEEGIAGATVIDSSGMGEYISNIPLFAEFIGFMKQNKNHSKTILALVPETRVDAVVEGIEGITGDLDKKQGAMIIALDVSLYKGTMKMM
ncbi:MAG: PTS sugar transporter subunit IIA [Candidatus Cloacimonetes bacterium]|nr:PTS sugar transporter subunit IIA [Candidatus Cloacimonadota bacterium]